MQTTNNPPLNTPQARRIRSTEAERHAEEQQRNAAFLAAWLLKKAQRDGRTVIADSANQGGLK